MISPPEITRSAQNGIEQITEVFKAKALIFFYIVYPDEGFSWKH